MRLEEEQAENLSEFIPRGNSKHRLPQSTESYDVQAESKKVRKKTTAKDISTITTRKKKTCNPEIDDAHFTENLALATEIIAQTPTNEDTSQTLVQQLVPSGLSQYVERNPPVVINPVGRGIRKSKGCGEKSQMQSNYTQTTWCSTELEFGANSWHYRTSGCGKNTTCISILSFHVCTRITQEWK